MLRFYSSHAWFHVFITFISIHPMLRFYFLVNPSDINGYNFNTSNVTVLYLHQILRLLTLKYFNTSNVTVLFKYECNWHYGGGISIHPMLRFYSTRWTNPRCYEFQYIQCYGSIVSYGKHCKLEMIISIHPMLRFYLETGGCHQVITIFQYIQCYGSICWSYGKNNWRC